MKTKHKKTTLLSTKQIPGRERLIFALDVPNAEQAKQFVRLLGDSVWFYKLGLELFMAGDYFSLIKWLRKKGKKVFVDLKFFDIPQTVASAVSQLGKHDVQFATVHGNENIMAAAIKEKNGVKILAVTVLTSLGNKDLKDLGFKCNVPELVLSRARSALKLGCDGVVSSGLEAAKLRQELGCKFLIVTPGIRPVVNDEDKTTWVKNDDQKRKTTVEQAFLNGADYIVVGRPIRDANNPKAVAEQIQQTISSVFGQGIMEKRGD